MENASLYVGPFLKSFVICVRLFFFCSFFSKVAQAKKEVMTDTTNMPEMLAVLEEWQS